MKNKRKINKIVVSVFLIILILIPSVTMATGLTWEEFLEIKNIIEENYYTEIDEGKLLEGAAKGLFFHLDPYSEYYTEDEYKQLEESLSGNQVGIGLYLVKNDNNEVEVLAPLEGGTAHTAGVRTGDIITKIDDKNLVDIPMEEVIELLKGRDGTFIYLEVKRGDRTLPFYIQREDMQVKPVEYKYIDKNIGYIKISQFIETTGLEFGKAMDAFDERGMKNIILDLRGNPGGYLVETLEIADRIIPNGPVVHVKYNDREETYESNAKFSHPKYKIAVIVDGDSASASEIIAGAIRDRGVGKIVGTNTFGKSKVQEILKLNKGGLKLTIAEYFTPNRVNINGIGITPDIVVENENNDEDLQMQVAIKLFK